MKTKIILIIGVLSSIYFKASAQDRSSAFNNMYFYAEYGQARAYTHFITGGVTVQVDHHLFKIRNAVAYDNISGVVKQRRDGKRTEESVSIQDLGFLYGRNYRVLKHHQIQFVTGISAIFKTDVDQEYALIKPESAPHQLDKRFTVGLPAEVRYSFHFKRHAFISCSTTLNANFLKSYAAWSVGAGFGLF